MRLRWGARVACIQIFLNGRANCWCVAPVAFYALVFFLVNAIYICLIWELVERAGVHEVSPTVRGIMWFRSITTLCLFGAAAAVALKYPLAGLGICICCLIVYLKLDPPGAGRQISRG